MPSKSEIKEIYFAVLNDDGTYGTPVLIRPMKETDLYADSDDEE
ncbi:hypothetical protein [Bacillus nitratireducens]|nr:hypothetical protein [Bacillus nitratireducens]